MLVFVDKQFLCNIFALPANSYQYFIHEIKPIKMLIGDKSRAAIHAELENEFVCGLWKSAVSYVLCNSQAEIGKGLSVA